MVRSLFLVALAAFDSLRALSLGDNRATDCGVGRIHNKYSRMQIKTAMMLGDGDVPLVHPKNNKGQYDIIAIFSQEHVSDERITRNLFTTRIVRSNISYSYSVPLTLRLVRFVSNQTVRRPSA